MIDRRDIRFRILIKLKNMDSSTSEFVANEFLSTLHPDLGTIKRALIDLIEDGYIKESNVDWGTERANKSTIYSIDTKGGLTRKDSERLLNENQSIRIYLTLKGVKFLIEAENLKYSSWAIRNAWWVQFVMLLAGIVLTLLFQHFFSIIVK